MKPVCRIILFDNILVGHNTSPPFERGGNTCTPALLVAAIGVLIILQAFLNSPFERGTGGFNKKAKLNIFMTITISIIYANFQEVVSGNAMIFMLQNGMDPASHHPKRTNTGY